MKIAGLRNIKLLPIYNVTDNISVHMRQVLKNELSSIRYSFKSLYSDLKIQNSSVDEKTLYRLGIREIGQTQEEGIRLVGENYNHIVSFPNPTTFKLLYLDKITGDTKRILEIQNNSFYQRSKIKKEPDFEGELEQVIDSIDTTLAKLRQEASKRTPAPYIPTKEQQSNLDEINKTLLRSKIHPAIIDFVKLSDSEMQMAKNISGQIKSIRELYQKFGNSVTRHNVKTYYKNYDSSKSSLKIMTFNKIGPNGEDISIGLFEYNSNPYLMIKAQQEGKNPFAFVISKDGSVQKNMPYETVRTEFAKKRHDAFHEYYTQRELDALNIKEYLNCASNELKLFEEHTANWQKKQADFIIEHTNNNIGSTQMFTPKIKKITKSIDDLKTNIRKHFEYLAYSYDYLNKNNVNLEFSRRGINLGKITPEGYDLRLTFPSVQGKPSTQILVMNGEEIKQSFYIIDEKLLKLNIKKVSDAFTHTGRQRYYYSQDYIDNSGLSGYIDLISKTLNKANHIISKITPETQIK